MASDNACAPPGAADDGFRPRDDGTVDCDGPDLLARAVRHVRRALEKETDPPRLLSVSMTFRVDDGTPDGALVKMEYTTKRYP